MENKNYKSMPLEVSVQIRVLHQMQGLGLGELQKIFPQYARTSIYNHCKKKIGDIKLDNRKKNPGRPKVLAERDDREILRTLRNLRKSVGTFSSQDIQNESGMRRKVCNRTVRRCLNKHKYGYFQCRRKGQLYTEDLPRRLQFARRCKRLPADFWT
jgi:DNA replication protein DnaC